MSGPHASQAVAKHSGVTQDPSRFERLLVPVDFSSASRSAYSLAIRLADWADSEIWLFHAAGPDENDEFLNHTGVPWGLSDVEGEVRAKLRDFVDAAEPGSGRRVQLDTVKSENVVLAVVEACQRHAPNLIVLGVHPHARRSLRRSVAERIAHAVSCPVLLVRGEPEPLVDADM